VSQSGILALVSPPRSWAIRHASREDVAGVVVAAQELLLELGSTPPPTPDLEEAVRELIGDHDAGVVIVARAKGEIVGMLAASWQLAIHVPGRYALIQDLWVHSAWRSRSIGADLMTALIELARERGMSRVEVGLPRESFDGIQATEAFYRDNGFQPLGPRMRRLLP
jgi:GNAT superfamily N-acetyltransferase